MGKNTALSIVNFVLIVILIICMGFLAQMVLKHDEVLKPIIEFLEKYFTVFGI